MSFIPGFAPDAISQWIALDFELQELVLDEIDRLAATPPDGPEHFADLVHMGVELRHYLFIHLIVDVSRRRIVVVGVGHHQRPVPRS